MVRIERDTLGWVDVPDDVYYGPQTTRAIRNFRVSTLKLPPAFIRAQAEIKMACARANMTAISVLANISTRQPLRSGLGPLMTSS
jgi:aspartate ammonia-lyase